MNRLSILGLATALVVLLFAAQSSAGTGIGVNYDWDGNAGVLRVLNAEGRSIQALNSSLDVVLVEFVPGPVHEVPCGNCGPDRTGVVLHVQIEGGASFSIDRDDDWFWD